MWQNHIDNKLFHCFISFDYFIWKCARLNRLVNQNSMVLPCCWTAQLSIWLAVLLPSAAFLTTAVATANYDSAGYNSARPSSIAEQSHCSERGARDALEPSAVKGISQTGNWARFSFIPLLNLTRTSSTTQYSRCCCSNEKKWINEHGDK